MIFCLIQALSSTFPISLLLLLHTRPFSPCPSSHSLDSQHQLQSSCSLPLPLFASLTLLPALPLTALGHELLLDSLEGRGCLKLLGRGFHSPIFLTPEPAKGTKNSVKKVGSQRTTSAAGTEISQTLTYPIHKFPGKFTHQPSLFFLPLLFQILSVFSTCALHLLSPCNVSSKACSRTSSLFLYKFSSYLQHLLQPCLMYCSKGPCLIPLLDFFT